MGNSLYACWGTGIPNRCTLRQLYNTLVSLVPQGRNREDEVILMAVKWLSEENIHLHVLDDRTFQFDDTNPLLIQNL